MAYTLRGRLELRLAGALLPLAGALALAGFLPAWWPVKLAALMLGLGLVLDAFAYHRLLPYQPGWLALPLGLAELGIVMGLVFALDLRVPLGAALGLFGGAWLLAQVLGHAVLPLLRLEYAEDGGELGRGGAGLTAAIVVMLASAGGVAWATQPPTVTLQAGLHDGPLLLDREQKLVGEPGAVVRGGIRITADGVVVRNLTVIGAEYGVEVDGATGVRLEDIRVSGASLDGINVRRGQVTIRDCIIQSTGPYTQGIDISFGFDLAPSLVERCILHGGREGLVSHFAHVRFRDNVVTGTSLRGITVTEMSMGAVERNEVRDALGVGIFCGDYSECEIEENLVLNTRPDHSSGDGSRRGYGVVAHFGAKATLADNVLAGNPGQAAAFAKALIERAD